MPNLEVPRAVGMGRIDRQDFYARSLLFLSTISFFAFPVVFAKFSRITSIGEMLAVGFAITMWMMASLVGIRRIPDVELQMPAARMRLRRACVQQIALLGIGAVVLGVCWIFPAK